MHGLKKFAGVVPAVTIALSLSACEQVNSVIDQVIDPLMPTSIEEARAERAGAVTSKVPAGALKEDGVLKVGLSSASSAPLVINSQGETSGVDVDVACAVADELGVRVQLVTVPGAADMDSSGVDIVMGVKTGDAADVAVVGSYAEQSIAFFCKGDAATLAADDIRGKTVGLQSGSASENELNKTNFNAQTQSFANLNEAFDALEQGSVGFVLCDAYSGAYLAATYPDIACVGTLDTPAAIGIGVPTANSELQSAIQSALDTVSTNGVLGIVRSRWIGSMGTLTTESQVSGITTEIKEPEPQGSGTSVEESSADETEAPDEEA